MSATTVVTWGRTTGGKRARMGARTAAHLDYTIARLAKAHPGAKLHVIQSAYNTGVAASAGTHDRDGCLDVYIEGVDWWDAQRFLRECGWAAWYRYPPTFGRHIHMVSLGCPGPLGIYVPGQIRDYYDHRTGLAGHARDDSWHPASIAATVFDYPKWLKHLEEERMSHFDTARTALRAADKDLTKARAEIQQVDKKRVRVRAQLSALWVANKSIRAVIKRLDSYA